MAMTRLLLPFMLSLFTTKAAESTLTMSRHYCSLSSTFAPDSACCANLDRVLRDLVYKAGAGQGLLFTSSGASSSEAVYGSFVCQGDVSKKEYAECVGNASLEVTRICRMTKVSILRYDQCMLRFSDTDFYMKAGPKRRLYSDDGRKQVKPDKDAGKVHLSLKTFAAILVTTIGLTSLFCILVRRLLRGRRRRVLRRDSKSHNKEDSIVRRQISELQSLQFHLQKIEAATNNFSGDNKLGEGGFGPVYKGTLPGGQEIAAKRLSRSSGQGAEEFKTEVELVAMLQHRNLVRLLGFSMERDETILVYENVPNRSLNHLWLLVS